MERNREWTDAVRSSLRDAEATPPAGGWERLERELAVAQEGASPAPSQRPAWRIYWPRIAAAAAVVLIGIVAGDLLLRPDTVLKQEGVVITTADGGKTAEPLLPGSGGEAAGPVLAQAVPPARGAARETGSEAAARLRKTTGRPGSEGGTAAETAGNAASLLLRTAAPDATSEDAGAPDSAESGGHVAEVVSGGAPAEAAAAVSGGESETGRKPASDGRATNVGSRAADNGGRTGGVAARSAAAGGSLYAVRGDARPASRLSARKRMSFSLSAGGGVSGDGGSAGRTPHFPMMSDAPGGMSSVIGNGAEIVLLKNYDYGESSFRHHQPLSVAFTVGKEFSHGLSLESGLNYTLLRSDVRAMYASEETGQTLHFLGIPLRVKWQFLERGRFSLYIGAGGMAEKCVSAKFGSKSVSEPGVQWSLLAAAGAQYRLGGIVGLYFEPEGSYYLTETNLRTVRTDSPLTLTLRLGVRLTF